MGEPHIITAPTRNRAELAGDLFQAESRVEAVRADLTHLNRVLAIMGFAASPDAIPASYKHPPRMFKNGQLRRLICDLARERPDLAVTSAIASEIAGRMGWDTGNTALLRAVSVSVKKVQARISKRRA